MWATRDHSTRSRTRRRSRRRAVADGRLTVPILPPGQPVCLSTSREGRCTPSGNDGEQWGREFVQMLILRVSVSTFASNYGSTTLRAVVPNRPTFRPTSCPSRYGNIREHCAAIVTTGFGRCCWCGRSPRQSRPGGSARAGRPSIGRSAWCWRPEDPRARGATQASDSGVTPARGGSPRARGDPTCRSSAPT